MIKNIKKYKKITKDLDKETIIKICLFKDSFWKYGLNSQLKWFNEYVKPNNIHYLIFDNDQLIGYICKEGIPLAEHAYEMDKLPKDFFITVLRNCERRQKIFYDLVPINVIKLSNGQCSLIDLESVYNIDKNLSNNLAKDVATIKPNNLLELIKNI